MQNEQLYFFLLYLATGFILFYMQVFVLTPKTEKRKELNEEIIRKLKDASAISFIFPTIICFIISLLYIPKLIITFFNWIGKTSK